MTENIAEIKPKLALEREEHQELRIYFFIGRKQVIEIGVGMGMFPIPKPPQIEEKIIFALAYKLEEAFEKGKNAELGFALTYGGQSMTVTELLSQLQLNEVVSPPTSEEPPRVEEPIPLHALKFEDFKSHLLFTANEASIIYQNPEDRETLKRIIETLKYESIELFGK